EKGLPVAQAVAVAPATSAAVSVEAKIFFTQILSSHLQFDLVTERTESSISSHIRISHGITSDN
ncbi:MAG: hypothetical protein IKI81_06000, partial [Selenomonadaceae bacterium]|nr:hypothetical protein [Selenomonadaceae bacterium]